ncbi:MAG: nucleotidyl transferase AbiEii/AbiGii toxin family protein [Bacteroidales bacterium]|nr:nucleotidyl transferase AbiEii/AbiGii toxin family protein [Bacteroidales bacterium]
MITQKELQRKADNANIAITQIEKDYMLTWILAGIAQDETLKNHLLFKGGTLLKKCYFEDYRFSEDLDFTVYKNGSLSEKDVENGFLRVCEYVKTESQNQLSFDAELKINRQGNITFEMGYVSVLGGFGANKKIKVDVSLTEKMVNEPVLKSVFHSYSDQVQSELQCYSLEEVLSEKMCALMTRLQPRDLFDLWYLLEIHEMRIDEHYNSFSQKANHRGIDSANFLGKFDETRLRSFEKQWNNVLQNQIEDLPKFEAVERELKRHFRVFDEYLRKQKIIQSPE